MGFFKSFRKKKEPRPFHPLGVYELPDDANDRGCCAPRKGEGEGQFYPIDDVEVRYDHEGRPYRLMREGCGCLVWYYYPPEPLPLAEPPLYPHSLGAPPVAQSSPWSAPPEGMVLDELQLCILSTPIKFHPLLTYIPGRNAAMVYDIRGPTSAVYACASGSTAGGGVRLDEAATAPRISCLKLAFRYKQVVLTLTNPDGVTLAQVIGAISS